MQFSHAYCPKCDKPSAKIEKCLVCKGWITWVYLSKGEKEKNV